MPPYKIVPMSSFADPNGCLINSKMNIISSTSNCSGQLFNQPPYLLPACERETNVPNGFYTNGAMPSMQNFNSVNTMIPMQRMSSVTHAVNHNHTVWAQGNNERNVRPNWTAAKPSGAKKHKRIRTAFTSRQMMELEQEYARTRYLDRSRRIELADTLALNERTIKIWFQNRRMKEKKDRAECYDECEPSTTDSSPEMIKLQTNQYQPQVPNVYNQNFYAQYPMASTPMTSHSNADTRREMNNYPTFVLDDNMQLHESYEPVPQAELKIENLDPSRTEITESLHDSPLHSDISAIDSVKSEMNDQSWDLSWIRSIQFDDDA